MNKKTMSVAQLRAARGLMNWNQLELAEASGVSKWTISRIENKGEMVKSHIGILNTLFDTFKEHNIKFYGDNVTASGVYFDLGGAQQ